MKRLIPRTQFLRRFVCKFADSRCCGPIGNRVAVQCTTDAKEPMSRAAVTEACNKGRAVQFFIDFMGILRISHVFATFASVGFAARTLTVVGFET